MSALLFFCFQKTRTHTLARHPPYPVLVAPVAWGGWGEEARCEHPRGNQRASGPPPHTGGGSEGRGWGGVGGGGREGKERKTHTRGTHRKTRVGASMDDKIRNKKTRGGIRAGGSARGGGEGRGEGTGWAGAGVVAGRRRTERERGWGGGVWGRNETARPPSLSPTTITTTPAIRREGQIGGGVEAQGQ